MRQKCSILNDKHLIFFIKSSALSFLLPVFFYGQKIIDPILHEPIRSAINTNYVLLNKQLDFQKTQLNTRSIKGKRLPHIFANAAYTYFNMSGFVDLPNLMLSKITLFDGNRPLSTNGSFVSVGVTATQMIFTGLQLPNAEKALKEKEKAEKFMIEAEKEAIAREVITTFDQLMLLSQVEVLISDTEKRLEKESKRVRKAIQSGLLIPYDRDKIKLAILELKSKKVELEGNRKLLRQRLEVLTHLTSERIENIVYPLESIFLLEENWNTSRRKELQALGSSGEAYKFLYQKEKGGVYPKIFAFGSVNYINFFNTQLTLNGILSKKDFSFNTKQLSLFPNFFLGIGARWNIFGGGEYHNKLGQAKIDISINENKIKDTQEKLNLLLEKSKTDYQTALQKLEVAEQQVQVSENNRILAIKQYQEGITNVTERLAAENEYYTSSLGYYSQVLHQRKAALELLYSTGSLLEKLRLSQNEIK
ncbi:MAG: TolC family protein [Bergeyella sp.]|nr:TolC family protein [Bergeyella sp.]